MFWISCMLLPLLLILLVLAGVYALFRMLGWLRPTAVPIVNPQEPSVNPLRNLPDTESLDIAKGRNHSFVIDWFIKKRQTKRSPRYTAL